MNDRETIEALKHPGRTPTQRRILDRIGCGDFCPPAKAKTLAAMVDAGLLQRCPDKILGRDGFGVIALPQFQMPIPVHMEWCAYWAEQPCEHGVADIEKCEVCMAPDAPPGKVER